MSAATDAKFTKSLDLDLTPKTAFFPGEMTRRGAGGEAALSALVAAGAPAGSGGERDVRLVDAPATEVRRLGRAGPGRAGGGLTLPPQPPVLEFEGAGGETPKAKGRRTVPCVLGSVALPIGAADAFRILRDRGEIFGSVEKFERRERVDLGEGRASDLAHSIMRWRVGPATGTFEQRLRRIHDACDRRLYFALDPAFKKTSMWERFDGCWQVVDRPGDHGGGCAVFLVQYMKLGGLAFPGIKKAMAWIVNGILKDLHAEAARLAAGPAAGPASHALADE